MYFALFQLIFVWVLLWFSRNWTVVYLGLGMLWSTTGRFMIEGGGITDFRLDFISICLFGILICLIIRSELLASRRWAAAVGVAAAYAVLFRYVVFAYVVGIVVIWFAVLLLRARFSKSSQVVEMSRRRILGLELAGIVFAVLIAPMMYYSRASIYWYYFLGHMGPDKAIRAAETGTTQLVSALMYYPRSLLFTHAGGVFDVLAVAILSVLALLAWRLGALRVAAKSASGLQLLDAALFLVVAFTVPLGILTIDISKSPVVGGVFLAPVLWLFLIGAVALGGRIMQARPWGRTVLGIVAVIAMTAGISTELRMATRRSPLTLRHDDTEQVLSLYDRLFQASRENGWSNPKLAIDRTYDYLHPQLVPALVYERHGVLLSPQGLLGGTVFPVARQTAMDALEHCDFAILAVGQPTATADFPFNRSMQTIEPALLSFAERQLIPLQRFHTFRQDIELYMRPSLGVTGTDAGWILSPGLMLEGDPAVLHARPRIELRGKTAFQWPVGTYHDINLPAVTAHWAGAGDAQKPIDVSIRKDGPDYRILLLLNPDDISGDRRRIELDFDRWFSMAQLKLNADTREFVLPAPDAVLLLPR